MNNARLLLTLILIPSVSVQAASTNAFVKEHTAYASWHAWVAPTIGTVAFVLLSNKYRSDIRNAAEQCRVAASRLPKPNPQPNHEEPKPQHPRPPHNQPVNPNPNPNPPVNLVAQPALAPMPANWESKNYWANCREQNAQVNNRNEEIDKKIAESQSNEEKKKLESEKQPPLVACPICFEEGRPLLDFHDFTQNPSHYACPGCIHGVIQRHMSLNRDNQAEQSPCPICRVPINLGALNTIRDFVQNPGN